ncbi:MAG: hypothetical protein ACUVRD_04010 [Bacteroidia bacterium]
MSANFVPNKEGWGIQVETYDKNQVLIIGPLVASTFLGGGSDDWASHIAVDGNGDPYIMGGWSSDFPTSGAYEESFNPGYYDVIVAKFNGSLS